MPKRSHSEGEQGPVARRPAQAIRRPGLANLPQIAIPGKPKEGSFCPAKPAGDWPHTDDQVRAWVEDVIQGGIGRGQVYLPEAVAYFANRCFWPMYRSGTSGRCQENARVMAIVKEYALQVLYRLQGHSSTNTEASEPAAEKPPVQAPPKPPIQAPPPPPPPKEVAAVTPPPEGEQRKKMGIIRLGTDRYAIPIDYLAVNKVKAADLPRLVQEGVAKKLL